MIRILDESFNILLTVPYHTSVMWTKRFTEGGSFSLSLPVDFETDIDLIDKIIRYNDNYGIIRYINITSTSTEIKGYDLKGILAMRQAEKKSYSGNIETVIKNIVWDNTRGNRTFPNFQMAQNQQRGDSITYEIAAYDSVENVLKDICTQYNVGYDITVDNKKMRFDVVFPKTADITYSERKKNITDYQYTYDKLDGATLIKNHGSADEVDIEVANQQKATWSVSVRGKVCFPDGSIEDVDLTHSVAASTNSLYVYCYLSGNNTALQITKNKETDSKYVLVGVLIPSTENNLTTISIITYSTGNEYVSYIGETEPTGFKRNELSMELSDTTTKIKTEINKKLFEDIPDENITASLLAKEDYKKEWNLGDFIKVKVYIMGQALTLTKQITEIEEIYEPNNIQINPTFGQNKDNIIRKIIKGRL